MRIVVTCGYPTSLHAIALIVMAARQGHKIECCLAASLFNWKRIRRELRQNGIEYLRAQIRNRLRVHSHHSDPELDFIKEYLALNNIGFTKVKETCAAVGAKFLTVPDLNHEKALTYLRKAAPDLIIYAGGGILRRQFLAISKIGVVNAHSGPLPHFRGMNAMEWTVFYGINPVVSIHFIDTGIDTGAILDRIPLKVEEGDNLAKLRGKAIVLGVQSILKTLPLLEAGHYHPIPQDPDGGRQFFRMAPELKALAEKKLAQGALCEYSPASFDFTASWFSLPGSFE